MLDELSDDEGDSGKTTKGKGKRPDGSNRSVHAAIFSFLDGWLDKEEQAALGAKVLQLLPPIGILAVAVLQPPSEWSAAPQPNQPEHACMHAPTHPPIHPSTHCLTRIWAHAHVPTLRASWHNCTHPLEGPPEMQVWLSPRNHCAKITLRSAVIALRGADSTQVGLAAGGRAMWRGVLLWRRQAKI